MAKNITSRNVTRNQATYDRNLDNIFVWQNEYLDGQAFNNDTGGDITLIGGELMGRNTVTGKLVIMTSAGTNNTALPIGVNKTQADVLTGADLDISICVKGDIDEGLLIFDGSDTLETIVGTKRYKDHIAANTVGIVLKSFDEQTKFDN